MPKNYVVEESFDFKGLPCCVIMTKMGHRCGYVGVYKNNKFWGCDYDDVEFLNKCPDVHGGLTYSSNKPDSGYPIETSNDVWWFGFDCGHYDDEPDEMALYYYFSQYIDYSVDRDGTNQGVIRTEQYVHDECEKLAEWLSKFINDNYLKRRTDCQTIINSIAKNFLEIRNELIDLEENVERGDITPLQICSRLKKIINEIGEA